MMFNIIPFDILLFVHFFSIAEEKFSLVAIATGMGSKLSEIQAFH